MSAASASSACVIFFSIIAVLMSDSAGECLPSLRMSTRFPNLAPVRSVAERARCCHPGKHPHARCLWRADGKRDAPDRPPLLQRAHGLGKALQGKASRDERADQASCGKLEHGVELPRPQGWVASPGLAGAHADD